MAMDIQLGSDGILNLWKIIVFGIEFIAVKEIVYISVYGYVDMVTKLWFLF